LPLCTTSNPQYNQQNPTNHYSPLLQNGTFPPSLTNHLCPQDVQPTSSSVGAWYVNLQRSIETGLTAQFSGKRIALPTRVEPKVFFANERTFLSWLNFTVILGALGVGMLNFGDYAGFWSALGFITVAVLGACYSLYTYHWRAREIRRRGQGGFDDRFGPTALMICLFFAIIVNFVLRVVYPDQTSKKH